MYVCREIKGCMGFRVDTILYDPMHLIVWEFWYCGMNDSLMRNELEKEALPFNGNWNSVGVHTRIVV